MIDSIPGPWVSVFFCINCEKQLTEREKYYSHGRCPHCGFKDKEAYGIVKTFERARREVTFNPLGGVFGQQTK